VPVDASQGVECPIGKWARARAIAQEEQAFQEQYEKHGRIQNLESRFRRAGPADALRMFETHTDKKGETLSQFEFEAMCERRCAVFGELPPLGPPDEAPKRNPIPTAR
jgi:hypothetical protein